MQKKIILTLILACFFMGYIDAILQPPYFQKSFFKILLFSLLPCLVVSNRNAFFSHLLSYDKKSIQYGGFVGGILFCFLFGGYFLTRNFFDFSNITPSLESNMSITKENFLFVSLYIALINSFLEEFFFRGFAFLELKHHTTPEKACCLSAFFFACYHVAMMIGWFSIPVFCLALVGLFVGGLIFNFFAYQYNSLYPSWLIHGFCNLGINAVGFVLFSSPA